MSTGERSSRTSHASGGSPKVTGTANRLRQFDADHQNPGETAGLAPRLVKFEEPGAK